jgi:hypothetical protein
MLPSPTAADRPSRFIGLCLGLASLAPLGSCSKTPESVKNYAGPPATWKPWILATPNPIPPGRGAGLTTVSWDTKAGSPGFVYLSVGGGSETPFSDGASYTKDARVVGKRVYEFRLYDGKNRGKLLATVKVTRRDR